MRNFATLLRKEETALFSSPIAYVVMTVFLLIMGYSFTLTLFLSHQPSMVHIFFQMFVLFMLTAPLITMRLLAEERKLRTLEVLLTAPVSEVAIVLAKFVASMSLIAVMLVLSGAYAAALAWFGDPDFGPIYSGYLGLVLFASALVGTGLLASALTANQVIAALVSLSVFLMLWIIDNFGWLLPSPADTLVVNLSLAVHFRPFAIGSIYLSDVGFFLSVTLLALAPNALARADAGEGLYGETNDKVITNAMFVVIAFFPTLILVLSLIQWRLDKRKHAKLDAAKRRAANVDWRGGW